MQKTLWICALGACMLGSGAWADELTMPQAASAVEAAEPAPEASSAVEAAEPASEAPSAVEPAPAAPAAVSAMPEKGTAMAAVLKKFGEPKTRHKPAGGDTPRHPAITRWDYEGYSVFFERGKVIDSVNHTQPAKLHHTNELKPLEY